MRTHILLATAGVTALAVIAFAPASARADDTGSAMQDRVAAVIAEYGGVQTAWNEVAWDDGDVILDLAGTTSSVAQPQAADTAATIGSCASGRHCVYSGSNYSGNKLTFSSCATNQSVAALDGNVRSIANNRTGKSIKAYDGSTLVATVPTSSGKNVNGTITKVSCS